MISDEGLYDHPRDWVFQHLAAGHWKVEGSRTLLEELETFYASTTSERFRAAVADGIVAVLSEPALGDLDERGRVWAHAMEFVRRLQISEAGEVLRRRVKTRYLARQIGGYADLHGRALRALNALPGMLNVRETWKSEREHPEYAALAFSFVRDRHPRRLPPLFLDAARLGFLRVAVRTTAFVHRAGTGADLGFQLLAIAAKDVRRRGTITDVREFARCVASLNLDPALYYRIFTTLFPRRTISVVVRCGSPLCDELRRLLDADPVRVEPDHRWGERRSPALLVVDHNEVDAYRAEHLEFEGGPWGAVLAAYADGMQPPARVHPNLRIVSIPRDDSATAAALVRTEVLWLLPSLTVPRGHHTGGGTGLGTVGSARGGGLVDSISRLKARYLSGQP